MDKYANFKAKKSFKTIKNTIKTRLQQQYKGINVYGQNLVKETNSSGQLVSLHGDVVKGINLASVTPTLTAKTAEKIVRKYLNIMQMHILKTIPQN